MAGSDRPGVVRLLAIACCAPLVYLQSQWLEGWGLGWMLWQHVVSIGFIALGAGFVLGILRGGRDWVAAPYFLIGLPVFFMPLTGFRLISDDCGGQGFRRRRPEWPVPNLPALPAYGEVIAIIGKVTDCVLI